MSRTSRILSLAFVLAATGVPLRAFATDDLLPMKSCNPKYYEEISERDFERRMKMENIAALFPDLEKKSPKLFKFLSSRASQRWKTSDERGWMKIYTNLRSGGGTMAPRDIVINTDGLVFEGASKVKDGRLVLKINGFALKAEIPAEANFPSSLVQTPYGSTTNSIDLGYSKMIGAVFSGIRDAVRSNPGITSVEIEADFVLSQRLEDSLVEMGFKGENSPLAQTADVCRDMYMPVMRSVLRPAKKYIYDLIGYCPKIPRDIEKYFPPVQRVKVPRNWRLVLEVGER